MQKCMRKKIAYAYKNGTSADVMGEQFIEFPRALCNIDNLPVKGQKSLVTGFYQGRYSNVIMQSFPANWTPKFSHSGRHVHNPHQTLPQNYGRLWEVLNEPVYYTSFQKGVHRSSSAV